MSVNVYRYSESIEFAEGEPSTYYGWYISTSYNVSQYADFEIKEARDEFVERFKAVFEANEVQPANHAQLIERVAGLLYVYANVKGDFLLELMKEEIGTLGLAQDTHYELIDELQEVYE